MKLSIIIPVFNEKEKISETIQKVQSSNTLDYEKEIIVVDDGSYDGTEKILPQLQKKYNFLLIRHSQNLGKGAAIRTGLKYASGDFVLIQDADLEYDPKDYPSLLQALSPQFLVIYGFRKEEQRKKGNILFFLGGKLMTFFFNLLFRTNLKDINTGYKLFKTEILKEIDLEENGFNFCAEVTAKTIKRGYLIKEVPINYYPREIKEGKKLKIVDGFRFLWAIIKYKIS